MNSNLKDDAQRLCPGEETTQTKIQKQFGGHVRDPAVSRLQNGSRGDPRLVAHKGCVLRDLGCHAEEFALQPVSGHGMRYFFSFLISAQAKTLKQ